MKAIQHKNRSHALLSASGSSRWLNCTPSAKLEDEFGEHKDSVYAAEGTLAHELAELFIRRDILDNISTSEYDDVYEGIINNELYSYEMPEYVNTFVDYCSEQYSAAKATGIYDCKSEYKVSLKDYVPESFGTIDCTIISGTTLEIIDFKYGKGVPVYADYNTQLMLYALGMLSEVSLLYDITTVRLTIVQPRIDNISSFDISVDDLYKWADEILKPKAEMAFAGEGELNSGDWCKFCSVKNRCRKLYEDAIKIAKHEFKKPLLLTDDEIVEILTKGPKIADWIDSVNTYAKDQAMTANKIWSGFKLVAGRSSRKWLDEDKAGELIAEIAPELSEDEIYKVKLNGITDIEKKIGKKKFALLDEVVVKSAGAPVLVPITDKRPALGIEDAKNEFSE